MKAGVPNARSADGLRIAFDTRGAGELALVFVHGWSCDRSYWNAQMGSFANDHRVVAIDLAGHGESGGARRTWTIESFGADVAAVVESLGLARVVLIGHSMGGDVIIEAAHRLGARVTGLVWVDTYRTLPVERDEDRIDALLAPFRARFVATTRAFVRGMFPRNAEPALVEHVVDDMAAAPEHAAVAMLEASMRYGAVVPERLAALRLPLHAINPSEPASDVDALARHGVRTTLLPDTGHFLMMEQPAPFDAALRDVLATLHAS